MNTRSYEIIATIKKHDSHESLTVNEIIVLSPNDSIEEFMQMKYGSWYDITDIKHEPVHVDISLTVFKEEAINILQSLSVADLL